MATLNIDRDIARIINEGRRFVFPDIKLIIHTPNEDYTVARLENLTIIRDFVNNVSDVIEVNFTLGLGDYREIIYKNIDNLEATLIMDFKDDETCPYYNRTVVFRERMRLVIKDPDKRLDASLYSSKTRDELNKIDMKLVSGTLKSYYAIAARQIYVNGIYKDYDLTTLFRYLFFKYLDNLTYANMQYKIKLAMEPLDNDRTYRHIIIPFEKLLILPYKLQQTDYPVYNGGVGTYIASDIHISPIQQERLIDLGSDNTHTLYMYSLFDHQRYLTLNYNKLNLYSSSKYKAMNEITYYRQPDDTGDFDVLVPEAEVIKKGMLDIQDEGDTFYSVNPYTIMHSTFNYDYFTRTIYPYTPLTNTIMSDEDNYTFIRKIIDTNIDSNLAKYKERILKNKTLLARFDIPKTDFRIFYPGMKLRYIVDEGDMVTIRFGTVYKVATTFNIIQQSSSTMLFAGLEYKSETE